MCICRELEWAMKETKPTYKQQVDVGLFDSGGIPDPRQALVPRLPRAGQRRQGARRENDMGLQGGIDKERPFRGRQERRVVKSRRGRHREEEKKRKANKKRQKDMDKLQPFGFFVSYE